MASRLADGKDLLNDAVTTITDKNATKEMSVIAIKVIRKSVLPLMDIASIVSWNSANFYILERYDNFTQMFQQLQSSILVSFFQTLVMSFFPPKPKIPN